MNAPDSPLDEARRRIADCFHGRDPQGRLIQRRDALNLAGLGLSAEEIEERFDGDAYAESERGLGEIGFEDLIHLRYLDLTSNKLERLPRGTRRMDGLRWLGLNFNQLTSIAAEAGNWKDLQRLYLRGNKLRTLPESVAIWGRLEEVDLAGNGELRFLPIAWLDVLSNRRGSEQQMARMPIQSIAAPFESAHFTHDGAPILPVVVDLEDSGLAKAFEKETGTKLTRDNFHEAAVQEWLTNQRGEPERVDIRRPSQRDIRELVGEWGEQATADALASLALRNESWLFFLENPASLGQRLVEEDDLKEIRAEVSRIRALSTSPSFVHPLWRAWYVTGLRRWRQEGEDRWKRMRDSVAARSPSGLGNPTVEAETGEQTPPPQASSDPKVPRNGGASSGRAGRQRKTE